MKFDLHPRTLPWATVGVLGAALLSGCSEAGPAATCAEGKVAEGQGYTSAVQDANTRYGLGLTAAGNQDHGTDLQQRAQKEGHVAQPNETVHVLVDAEGHINGVGFGGCPDGIPDHPLATPAATTSPAA